MLEDEVEDVIAKAAKGHGVTSDPAPDDLAEAAERFGLDFPALQGLPRYEPEVELPPGVSKCVTPFGHLGVNAWLLEKGESRVLFDTGTDGETIDRWLGKREIGAIAITHNHVDHVGGYPVLQKRVSKVYAAADCGFETEWNEPGDFVVGGLKFRVLEVTGHSTPSGAPVGLAYFTKSLEVPVCVVGDALFAGSMGGCMTLDRYQLALDALRRLRDELPAETVILPGHGPATTLALERKHNAFMAGLS